MKTNDNFAEIYVQLEDTPSSEQMTAVLGSITQLTTSAEASKTDINTAIDDLTVVVGEKAPQIGLDTLNTAIDDLTVVVDEKAPQTGLDTLNTKLTTLSEGVLTKVEQADYDAQILLDAQKHTALEEAVALAGGGTALSFDDVPTALSDNPVKSKGILSALSKIKQPQFEEFISDKVVYPTAGFNGDSVDNPSRTFFVRDGVTIGFTLMSQLDSGPGVVAEGFDSTSPLAAPMRGLTAVVIGPATVIVGRNGSGNDFAFCVKPLEAQEATQSTLILDDAPTENSSNGVSSNGIFQALSGIVAPNQVIKVPDLMLQPTGINSQEGFDGYLIEADTTNLLSVSAIVHSEDRLRQERVNLSVNDLLTGFSHSNFYGAEVKFVPTQVNITLALLKFAPTVLQLIVIDTVTSGKGEISDIQYGGEYVRQVEYSLEDYITSEVAKAKAEADENLTSEIAKVVADVTAYHAPRPFIHAGGNTNLQIDVPLRNAIEKIAIKFGNRIDDIFVIKILTPEILLSGGDGWSRSVQGPVTRLVTAFAINGNGFEWEMFWFMHPGGVRLDIRDVSRGVLNTHGKIHSMTVDYKD
jgi:hypothetical protein